MELKVKDYLESVEISLKSLREKLSNPQYCASMPREVTIALAKNKISKLKEAIAYLKTLDLECVLSTGTGLTKEGVEYYKIMNK